MNLCNIHSQWYTTHCVYCGKPGESKIQDLQKVEPFIMKLTKEQIEQLEEVEKALDATSYFNQKLYDLFNLDKQHPPKRFRDIANGE